jgi:hypothetical protein
VGNIGCPHVSMQDVSLGIKIFQLVWLDAVGSRALLTNTLAPQL